MKSKNFKLILITAAILAVTLTFSGCGIFRSLAERLAPSTQPSTAVETTETATTGEVTTEEVTTQAPTEEPTEKKSAAQSSSDNPGNQSKDKTSKSYSGMTLITDGYYKDYTIGATFYLPDAWVSKVYAKSGYNGGAYYLDFYEKSNYEWGVDEQGYEGMGFLFSVSVTDEESTGDWIDYPAGSIVINGQRKYLTYFKPTDVRFNYEDSVLTENYNAIYQDQRYVFESCSIDSSMNYLPSANNNAITLNTN